MGKDGTAIAAMLILKVRTINFCTVSFTSQAHEPSLEHKWLEYISYEEIMRDYALTRVGAGPMREATVVRFANLLQDPDIAAFAANVVGCKIDSDLHLTRYAHTDTPRPSAIRATLAVLREEYGGAAGYLKIHLGLSGGDVGRIVENLASGRT